MNLRGFVTRGHQGRLQLAVATHLAVIDGRQQTIADALAALRFGLGAALAQEVIERFAGAALPDVAVGLAIALPQVAEIADAFARGDDLGLRCRAGHLQYLEREAGR